MALHLEDFLLLVHLLFDTTDTRVLMRKKLSRPMNEKRSIVNVETEREREGGGGGGGEREIV